MAGQDPQDMKEFSLTEPSSAPEGHSTPANRKADANTLGEAEGGFLGAVGGMSLGAVGGPIGMLLGGLAGAVGGWWAGKGIADALTADDEEAFRAHYAEQSPPRMADRSYETVRPAYVAGYLAGRNPDYSGRRFEEVEPDLEAAWGEAVVDRGSDWLAVRGYSRSAFERARSRTPGR